MYRDSRARSSHAQSVLTDSGPLGMRPVAQEEDGWFSPEGPGLAEPALDAWDIRSLQTPPAPRPRDHGWEDHPSFPPRSGVGADRWEDHPSFPPRSGVGADRWEDHPSFPPRSRRVADDELPPLDLPFAGGDEWAAQAAAPAPIRSDRARSRGEHERDPWARQVHPMPDVDAWARIDAPRRPLREEPRWEEPQREEPRREEPRPAAVPEWEEPRSRFTQHHRHSLSERRRQRQSGATALAVVEATRRSNDAARRTQWREGLTTGLLGVTLVVVLFVDGWNHLTNLDVALGPFVTQWHGLLYTAFAGTSLYTFTRNQQRGRWSPRSVRPGYRLGVAGAALGVVALLGDAIWHATLGPEQDVARLISPFPLVLLVSVFLLSVSSFRSRWLAPTPRRVKRLQTLLPALSAAIAGTALIGYYVQYSSPLVDWQRPELGAANDPAVQNMLLVNGVVSVVAMTLVFMAPVLLILKRWHPPFGTVTWLFGGVSLLLAGLAAFTQLGVVLSALGAGLVADLLIRFWRPGRRHAVDDHVVAAIVPLALWTSHHLSQALGGVAPPSAVAIMGGIVLASLASLGVSLLMNSPSAPEPSTAAPTREPYGGEESRIDHSRWTDEETPAWAADPGNFLVTSRSRP